MGRRTASGRPAATIRTLWAIAKSPELSLTDEELHLVVQRETGKDSLRALTGKELAAVARVLQQMKDGATKGKDRRTDVGGNPHTVSLRQKIYRLCEELGWGEDRRRMDGMARRVCGVDRVEWLNVPQCIALIEALKAIIKRKGENKMMKSNEKLALALLNTSILTAEGEYTLRDITLEEAQKLVAENELDSAIGHASTAQIMTTLLDVEVPVNRQMFCQQPGQAALVFKLAGRPEEGKILTVEEIQEIGYKFQLLTRK